MTNTVTAFAQHVSMDR